MFVLQKHSPRIPPEVIKCVYTTLNMKNELLQRGDCLKYWKKYGRNTLLYPLALRSGTEALPPAPPSSSRPERLSANAFPTPGPKRFLTTVPFFNWHKVLLGILALSE